MAAFIKLPDMPPGGNIGSVDRRLKQPCSTGGPSVMDDVVLVNDSQHGIGLGDQNWAYIFIVGGMANVFFR